MTAERRSDAARLLQWVARDDRVGNGVRLHCLRAADLLVPRMPLPARADPGDPATAIRTALNIVAALPLDDFDEDVRQAARHARRALLKAPGDSNDGGLAS